MPKNQCPYCSAVLTEYERTGVQCPVCQQYFESRITPERTEPPTPRPAARRRSASAARSPASSGSGIGSAWWLIPIALFGVRACVRIGSNDRPTPRPDYSYEQSFRYNEGQFTPPKLDRSDPDHQRAMRVLEEYMKERDAAQSAPGEEHGGKDQPWDFELSVPPSLASPDE